MADGGDIFNEFKGAGDAGCDGAGKEERDKAGGCGGDLGDIVPAESAAVWAVSGRRSGGAGASTPDLSNAAYMTGL